MPNNAEDKLTQAATMAAGLCAGALNFSALTDLAQAAGYAARQWVAAFRREHAAAGLAVAS